MKLSRVGFHEQAGVHVDGIGTVRVAMASQGWDIEVNTFGVILTNKGIRTWVPFHKVESGTILVAANDNATKASK